MVFPRMDRKEEHKTEEESEIFPKSVLPFSKTRVCPQKNWCRMCPLSVFLYLLDMWSVEQKGGSRVSVFSLSLSLSLSLKGVVQIREKGVSTEAEGPVLGVALSSCYGKCRNGKSM